MTDGQAPTVHAVVVHYRSAGTLEGCVQDLLSQEGVCLDVTVVDCGPDGSVEALIEQVRLVRPGRNLGYAGGNNFGVAALPADNGTLLLVNPDVRLPNPGTVRLLVDQLADDDRLAAVAPSLRRTDGRRESTGSTWLRERAEAVHTGGGAQAWPHPARQVALPWLNGACLLVSRRAWQDVGPFDERFFLYFEEVEWCLRANDRGWRLELVEEQVEHVGSLSFGGSTKGAYYAVRNTHLLGRLHGRGGRWQVHWLLRTLRLFKHRPDQRTAVLAGALDTVRGRYGAKPGDEGIIGLTDAAPRCDQ